jgi:signal peptidase I
MRNVSEGRKKESGLGWVISIAIAIAIAVLVRTFVFEPIRVDGDSMLPTLHSHQSLGVEKVSRYFGLPERGEIVIVHYPKSDDAFVKRVIGLPGETVEIRDSTVYINGEPLTEDYTSGETYHDMAPVTVPEDSVFVMGDNRANSQDSRYVGSISRDMIIGRALFIIWPLNEIQWID